MDARTVKDKAREWGADVVGIADLNRLQGIETTPPSLFSGHKRAVSIAVRLSKDVMDEITDGPTPLYARHYKSVNALLDRISRRLTDYLKQHGASAEPIPASLVLNRENHTGHLSHKAVAVAAGVGWQGKSLLTVTPDFGPRIRLTTVLTDMELAPDAPIKNRCGTCDKCSKACPAGAVRNVNTQWHYESREQALHFDRCVAKLTKDFSRREHINSLICGVCAAVCPWGRK